MDKITVDITFAPSQLEGSRIQIEGMMFATAEGLATILDTPIAINSDELGEVAETWVRVNETTTGMGLDFFFRSNSNIETTQEEMQNQWAQKEQ